MTALASWSCPTSLRAVEGSWANPARTAGATRATCHSPSPLFGPGRLLMWSRPETSCDGKYSGSSVLTTVRTSWRATHEPTGWTPSTRWSERIPLAARVGPVGWETGGKVVRSMLWSCSVGPSGSANCSLYSRSRTTILPTKPRNHKNRAIGYHGRPRFGNRCSGVRTAIAGRLGLTPGAIDTAVGCGHDPQADDEPVLRGWQPSRLGMAHG